MWFLFILVLLLVAVFLILSHARFTPQKIAIIGLMAALSFVSYTFFRIPLGPSASFHLGNAFVVLTALWLDGYSGGLAGAIGLSLADIMAGDPAYAITTFILKFFIGLITGLFKEKVGIQGWKLWLTSASGLAANVFLDPFIGFFRTRYLLGQSADLSLIWSKIAAGVTLVNSLLSCLVAVALYLALRKRLPNQE